MTEEKLIKMKNNVFNLRMEEDGIAWLSIDVPNNKMNTLKDSFISEIENILNQLVNKLDVQGLIIYSAKEDNFIAGADINMLDNCQTEDQAFAIAKQGQQLFQRIEDLPFHVVAAINGVCLGGGLELALACHSRIATDEVATRLGLPEVKLGLLPGSGGTQRLPRLIGTLDALDLILTGKTVTANKAKKLGLVDEVVPRSILLDIAKKTVLQEKPKRKNNIKNWLVSGNPIGRSIVFNAAKKKTLEKTKGNYPATDMILNVIEQGLAKGYEQGLEIEAQAFGQLVITKASCALRHLFFISNENKKQKGSNAEPESVENITVIGGGLMGAGITYVSAEQAKALVQVKDLSNDSLLKTLQYSYKLLDKKRKIKRISTPELQKKMANISVTSEYKANSNSQLVVEAVFENLQLKHQIVQEVESNFKPDTIFATNTSSLPIAKIAQAATRPENVIGLHYFSPVEKMPLVEIIPHETTSEQTIATTVAFAKKQGKFPIVVADRAGFYVNRILAPYLNEAGRILLEGESIEHIDNALADFGFPLGPLALLDEVGIDICSKVSPILSKELGDRFAAPAMFDLMLNDQRLGRKTQKGFYSYQGKKKQVDKSVYELLDVNLEPKLESQEIALRCFLLMLNECARCFDENIIRSAQDGDLGAVFGIGFPPFLGGPFCYMDDFGIVKIVNLMRKYQRRYGERFAPCDLLVNMMVEDKKFYPAEHENTHR